MKSYQATKYFFLLLLLFSFSCARTPFHDGLPVLLKDKAPSVIEDDLELSSFINGVKSQIEYHKKLKQEWIQFGPVKVLRANYINSLEELVAASDLRHDKDSFISYIKENFVFFSVYGDRFPADILLTSYYEPLIKGSKTKQSIFTQALYRYPSDMVEISFSDFVSEGAIEGESKRRFLIGKMSTEKNIRGNYVISPYYSREEIDQQEALKNKSLEICYVDPIDAFFLQIQGSGIIEFENQERVRVGYAGSNGRAYHSIGKFLHDLIPADVMTADKIENHLRTLSPFDRQKILNLNPSYVFFRTLESEPITTNNTEVIAGRTIATDPKYFSKGLIAYLYFQKPHFKDETENFDLNWQGRFVIDQDTGGAIKGVRRADLFWGQGKEAKRNAGVLRHEARLYYLAPTKYLVNLN